MGIRLIEVRKKDGFFMEGDDLVSIGGREVKDQLDVIHILSNVSGKVSFEVERMGERFRKELDPGEFEEYGVRFEEMKFKRCRSKCIFCFVDQMPEGLRPSLYFKDDDYRLSFLFGNYVTLNDLRREDMDRIVEYHLSPLYVSVHAVDREVRERMFGRPIKRGIMETLRELGERGIYFHTQVVLVPGINDGDVLEQTVDTLFGIYPSCMSLAVVPVGLTDHRVGLADIRGVSAEEAGRLVEWSEAKAAAYRESTDGRTRFLYLSDELYLMSNTRLPEDADYDGYPQLSNGVGMCRDFLKELELTLEKTPGTDKECRFAVITGKLGYTFFMRYVDRIIEDRAPWMRPEYISVENKLFGESVTVSGLLSGKDIIESSRKHKERYGVYVIPPNALNGEGKLIDDLTVGDLEKELGARVVVPDSNFAEETVIELCGDVN